MSRPEHFALTARQLIASLKPQETDMTSTNQPTQPLDLDAIRTRRRRFEDAWDFEYMAPDGPGKAAASAEDVPALIAEVERLRAANAGLRWICEAMAQGVTPDQIQTDEWDGLPFFDTNGKIIDPA